MKIYKTKDEIFKNLIHIDAYRLDKSEEILKLGWIEIISNKNNLIIVEWPEKIKEYINEDAHIINLEHKEEDKRSIKFDHNFDPKGLHF